MGALDAVIEGVEGKRVLASGGAQRATKELKVGGEEVRRTRGLGARYCEISR